jgi:hypothetical protein
LRRDTLRTSLVQVGTIVHLRRGRPWGLFLLADGTVALRARTPASRPNGTLFFEIVPEELLDRMVVIPGKHDTNIARGNNIAAVESEERIGYQLPLVRMLAALDRIQGHRTWISNAATKLATLRRRSAVHADELNKFSDKLGPFDVSTLAWWQLFSMVARVENC